MSDWRTYAKAARSTARKQAPDLRRQAESSIRRSTERAGGYARAAGRAVEGGTRDSRRRARRTAAAYSVVTARSLRRARIGERLVSALRDAVLMGVSIAVIWFVVTRTGIAIPFSAVLIVILLLMVIRFGWALFSALPSEDEELEDDLEHGPESAVRRGDGPAEREYAPRAEHRASERRR